MFNKIRSALLALAAVATLGLGAIVASTDSADARGFGGGFKSGGGSFGRVHVGAGRHIGHRPSFRPGRHIGHRPIFRPGRFIGHRHIHLRRHIVIRPHWCHRWHRHGFRRHCGFVRWPRPVIIGGGYAVAPAVAARPCTCLTKTYTADNLVVFKDLCTREVASAPAGNTQVRLP
jgi:hypothetical protein